MTQPNISLPGPLPCIICGKQLEDCGGGSVNQPYAGTTFVAHGQYGSTVWDPMNDDLCLEINICDSCLRERKVRVAMVTSHVQRSTVYEPWQ
jgi:hypothetical protein